MSQISVLLNNSQVEEPGAIYNRIIMRGSMTLSRDLRWATTDTSKLALHSKGIQFREDNARIFPLPPHLAKVWLHMASPLAWLFLCAPCGPGGSHYILLLFQFMKSEMSRGAAGEKLSFKVHITRCGSRLGDIQECAGTWAWQLSQ